MRAFASYLMCVLMVVGAEPAWAKNASNKCDGGLVSVCITTTTDGYVYAYDSVSHTVVPIPKSAAGDPDPKVAYLYNLTPACSGARPYSGATCVGAQGYCAANGQSGLHEYVWRTPASTISWALVGDLCTGGRPNPIPVADAIKAAQEYEEVHVPHLNPTVQPSTATLVNLPVIVSVDNPEAVVMTVDEPVPGQLVARPSYRWSFDDGAVLNGAGIPYDGTNPLLDPTHYLQHAYGEPSAQASVTLTVTWQATFTAAGQTFNLLPLAMPPVTTTYAVYEAHSVLVDGGFPTE